MIQSVQHTPVDRTITALIPLYAADGGGAVLEVLGGVMELAERSGAGIDPRIERLANVGVHETGAKALTTSRMLPFPATGRLKRMRLSGTTTPNAYLEPENVKFELADENDSSAELGLALAFTAVHRKSKYAEFIATGTLLDRDTEVSLRRHGPVGAVGGLSEKIAAVGDWLERCGGAVTGKTLYFFTPVYTESGEPVEREHAYDFASLLQRAEALSDPKTGAHPVIIHKPVSSLKEAAEILDAVHAPLDWREVWARLILGGVSSSAALLVAGATALAIWMMAPTNLSFGKLDWASGPSIQSPVAIKVQREGGSRAPRPDCRAADGRPLVAFGEELSLVLDTDPTRAPQALIDTVFDARVVTVAGVGALAEGGVQVTNAGALHPSNRPSKADDRRITFTVPVTAREPAGMTYVGIVARKNFFGYGELEQGLADAIGDKTGIRRIRAAAAFLEELPGGYIGFEFQTAENLSDCEEGS